MLLVSRGLFWLFWVSRWNVKGVGFVINYCVCWVVYDYFYFRCINVDIDVMYDMFLFFNLLLMKISG